MVGVDAPRAVFTASGSVRPVGTAEQFLAGIRANDTLEVVSERRATLGGQPATRIVVRARPRPPYFPGCPTPCSLLFPLEDTTVFITPDSAEVLTVADRAGRVLVAQWSRDRSRPEYLSEARAVIDSIRFVDR
jgi:hypothetical protein